MIIIFSLNKSMKLIKAFFGGQLYQVIQKGKYIDARIKTHQLLTELTQKNGKQLLIRSLEETKTQIKCLRVLSVLGIILLYSDNYYDLILEHLKDTELSSSWTSKQIIRPFGKWIRKCCETASLFKSVKKKMLSNASIMERMPYSIKLLKELMLIISAVPKFGRYYNLKESHIQYTMISEVIMSLNNMIYSHLKITLEYFLYNQSTANILIHRQVLRWVFNDILPDMNETIKSVTLSKHFQFYRKGIVTKMIYVDQYSLKVQDILKDLMSDGRTKRSNSLQIQTLKSKIFPNDGSFNEDQFIRSFQECSRAEDKGQFVLNFLNQTAQSSKKRVNNLKKYRQRYNKQTYMRQMTEL